MNFLESANVNNTLSWTQSDRSNSDIILIDNSQIKYNYIYNSGSGYGEANIVWYATDTLTTGQNKQIDMFNLVRNVFGSNLLINLSGGYLKAISIENLNTGLNQDIRLGFTGTGAFNSPFESGSIYVNVPAESNFSLNSKAGYPINTGQRYLYIFDKNSSGNINYEIAILGAV